MNKTEQTLKETENAKDACITLLLKENTDLKVQIAKLTNSTTAEAPDTKKVEYALLNGKIQLYPKPSFQLWTEPYNLSNTKIDMGVHYHHYFSEKQELLARIQDLFIHADGTFDADKYQITMLYLASVLHDYDTDAYLHLHGDGNAGKSFLIELYVTTLGMSKVTKIGYCNYLSYNDIKDKRPLAYYVPEPEHVDRINLCVSKSRPHIFVTNYDEGFVTWKYRKIIHVPMLRRYRDNPDPSDPRTARADPGLYKQVADIKTRNAFFSILVDFYGIFRDDFDCDINKVIARYGSA